jgi:hypothetical protein
MTLPPPSATVPFDRVVVKETGGSRTFSVERFLALPLSQRVKVILERRVSFYLRDTEVDRNTALNGLRRARAIV